MWGGEGVKGEGVLIVARGREGKGGEREGKDISDGSICDLCFHRMRISFRLCCQGSSFLGCVFVILCKLRSFCVHQSAYQIITLLFFESCPTRIDDDGYSRSQNNPPF